MDPGAVFSDVVGRYMRLPMAQKIALPLLLLASVAGIVFVSRWASAPDYQVLYSDLSAPDAAAIVERLKQQKIAYEVRGDGSTVAISPGSLVHELRLSMASEGIPKTGKVGLELFEGYDIAVTQFGEKIKLQRAMQGELERTIGSLDGVTAVRVHVTQPEKSVFANRSTMATASVMLKLRPGAQLEKKQVKGIAQLVAGSVEGLSVENVSIIDVYGNLLTTKENEESLTVEATRLTYQREIEQGYAQHVEQMLTKILGPGKVVARVSADMDFSESERQEESYDPGGRVVRSERTVSEAVGAAQRGGVPGVVSNLNNANEVTNLAAQTAADNSNRKEDVKNYEVSRAVTKSTSPRGKLLRLSVAVLVDGNYEEVAAVAGEAGAAAADGQTKRVFKPLEQDTLFQIEGIVRSAVGYNPERGDVVTVENIPFSGGEASIEKALKAEEFRRNLEFWVRNLAPILIVLLFFLLIARPIVGWLIKPTDAEVDLSRLLPSGLQELEQELDTERQRAKIPDFEPAVDLEQLEELMAENSRVVRENPQQAALLIRYWLNDGRL